MYAVPDDTYYVTWYMATYPTDNLIIPLAENTRLQSSLLHRYRHTAACLINFTGVVQWERPTK